MDIVIVGIVFAVYLVFVYLMAKGKLNVNLALLAIATLIVAVVAIGKPGYVTWEDFMSLGNGVVTMAGTIFQFIVYAVFGMVLMENGILAGLLNFAVDFGRKKSAFALVMIFTVACFIVALGSGNTIAFLIGAPLYVALGMEAAWACYMMKATMGCFYYLLAVGWTFITPLTGNTQEDMMPFVYCIVGCSIIQVIILIIYTFKVKKITIPEHIEIESGDADKVPKILFLAPLLPLVLTLFAKWNANIAYLLSAVLIYVICNLINKRNLSESADIAKNVFKKAVESQNALISLMMCLGVLVAAINLEGVRTVFASAFQQIIPSNMFIFLIVMIVIMLIGALFRGIAHPQGLGVALISGLLSVSYIKPELVSAIIAVLLTYSLICDPTTGGTMFMLGITKADSMDYMKKSIVPSGLLGIVLMVIAVVMYW